MQISDDLFLGPVFAPGPLVAGNSAPMERGVGPMGRIYLWDIVPATLGPALLAPITLAGAAGVLPLAAGAGVTRVVDLTGTARFELDVPRSVSLTVATTNQSAISFTVTGYDAYGQPMSEVLAGPNANTVNTLKAFKSVTSIAFNAAIATNGVSAGIGDKFGLPFRVPDAGYIAFIKWAGTLADNAGTFVAAVATNPSTTTTGDVRGTYTPTSASDGSRRLVAGLMLPALASGPQATRIGALGVNQNLFTG